MSGTHVVHDQFYGDEKRFAEPKIVTVETETEERSNETVGEKIAFKIKVKKAGNVRLNSIEFHAESWEEALAYAREKGEPVSIALAKEK
ncbi:MAG: hypothetical protein Q8Q12_00580 [bacterium]|nr:hypothetical protein [bacterium]